MQDRPDAPDLLEAVAAYLFAELRPQAPREQRFKVLVAANVCAVVARELRAGAAPDREDLAAFTRLLGGESPGGSDSSGAAAPSAADARAAAAELAARIRAGELDSTLPEVLAELREHARRKLEIARPDYAD